MQSQEKYLKDFEVVSECFEGRIALQTLRNWRSLGFGPPFYKIGKNVFYRGEEVREWIESQRIVPAGSAK